MFQIEINDKPKIANITIELEEVKQVIKNMKRNSSPGYDLIPTETYIELNEIIAPTLCNTFNKALKQRKGLYEKIPVIIQVLFKGGDQTAIKQYRPLSLLPVLLCIFDMILFTKLDAFIEENNILSIKPKRWS